MPFAFGAAAPEGKYVYGACRPAHPGRAPGTTVDDWLAFVRERGIERVCCLLDEEHLRAYDGLLDGAVFRTGGLPFLRGSVDADRPVVVHDSAGSGRTGHVLVGWLVAERGYGVESAIGTVEGTGRNPLEAPGADASDLADLSERWRHDRN